MPEASYLFLLVGKSIGQKQDQNKFYYDFGNTLFAKAAIELSAIDDFNGLVDLRTYREAQKYFLKVKKDRYGHYERARTNLAIIYGSSPN